MSLPPIDISAYVRYHNVINNGCLPDVVAEDLLEYLNYNIRDCNRFFNTINYIYDYIMRSKPAFNTTTYIFVRDIIFVMLLCIKFKRYQDYKKIIDGIGENLFVEYINQSASAIDYIDSFKIETQTREEILKNIYDALFIKKSNEVYELKKINIDKFVRNDLKELLSFINENIKLE